MTSTENTKMAFLKLKCPECDCSTIKEQSSLGQENMIIFSCNHWLIQKLVDRDSDIDMSPSTDGKYMFPFQIDGVKFAIESNVRCLFADEMGLGKTVEALKTIKSRPVDLSPVAVFCKASLKLQWFKEVVRWCGKDFIPQIITDAKDRMEPGWKCYIFSLDLLRRFNGELKEQFKECGIKTVIIDEVQLIKNHQSKRAIAVMELCKEQEHIMGLSGTPIKNRAPEYFPILNILRPEMFPVFEQFVRYYCHTYWDGYGRPKVGGLKDPEEFHEKTKDFIIRREREEVMPDLPKINRQTRFCELQKQVESAYDREETGLTQFLEGCSDGEQGSFATQSNILAYIARMRHLTGLSKVQPTVDFVEEFLLSNERKLTIFVHHKDVHQLILDALKKTCELLAIKAPLSLTSDLNSETRSKIQEQFLTDSNYRVLVASTLAFGEGLNLQSCSDCLLVERQWNPANEEQAEARFVRIGQKASSVQSTYVIASGTVDEYLTEIVERKREIVAQTLSNKDITWNESEIIKELAERIAQAHREKWRPK